ncbi:helix-turn-helix domain-containing protein [Streptosporangium sp. NPDC023615]|uniref:helix-turn-helix domain-containing protein n=1 Tax=Streptosporangium sp. NPDC023615 TaxID=3154794 RepID=UPI003437B685
MTPREVARLFGVEPTTVIDWAKNGKLKSTRTPGGRHRFHPADVEAEMAATEAAEADALQAVSV